MSKVLSLLIATVLTGAVAVSTTVIDSQPSKVALPTTFTTYDDKACQQAVYNHRVAGSEGRSQAPALADMKIVCDDTVYLTAYNKK